MRGAFVRLLPVQRDDHALFVRWMELSPAGVLANGSQTSPRSAEDWERAIESGTTRYAVIETSEGTKIGAVSWQELAYPGSYLVGGIVGDGALWDTGLGLEGAMLLVAYLFDFENAHRVELVAALYNKRTLGFLVKGDTVVEALLRDFVFADSHHHDVIVCSLMREEYYAPFDGYQPVLRATSGSEKELAHARFHAHLSGEAGEPLRSLAETVTQRPGERITDVGA
ncbi:MAG TPA: GNAT family N-acetyltransferase [Candidatus Nocardiopsis merdipullorum]|nr:GNAT family N-acetyltransferase [Candidatus Nocardiopsis merdipullorum]